MIEINADPKGETSILGQESKVSVLCDHCGFPVGVNDNVEYPKDGGSIVFLHTKCSHLHGNSRDRVWIKVPEFVDAINGLINYHVV